MVFRLTRRALDSSSPLQEAERKMGGLVIDFIRQCDRQKVSFHAPLLFGLRDNGMRGLYLAEGHSVKRGEPLMTIPYSAFITNESIMREPEAFPLTLSQVKETLADDESRHFAEVLHLGIQVACQLDRLPAVISTTRPTTDGQGGMPKMGGGNGGYRGLEKLVTEADSNATIGGDGALDSPAVAPKKRTLRKRFSDEYTDAELVKLHTDGAMPWCRMIDDEDWSDTHIVKMYKQALDEWQQGALAELGLIFGRALSKLHDAHSIPLQVENLRRISRVMLARIDQVPLEQELRSPRVVKVMRRMYRSAMRTPQPRIPASIPMLDMLNHSNRPNAGVRFQRRPTDGEPVATVFALNHITGGHEVCRHYNFAMDRANALFRYGFLPFELISVPEPDPWKEHYVKGVHPNLAEETPDELKHRHKVDKEVGRLQSLFAKARSGK